MKVKDILSKIVDNYYKIVVEVFDSETNLIKQRYYIQPHSVDRLIPHKDVMEKEVEMIIPHLDSLVISVKD